MDDMLEILIEDADAGYSEVEERFGEEVMRKVERHVMLTIIDKLWVEHLTAMDELREGVGLQAYAQKDPLAVYKTQGYDYFQQLLANIQHDVVHTIFRVQPAVAQQPIRTQVIDESDQAPAAPGEPENGVATPRKARKVGVNEPCPCGSGKKFKHCHGAKVKSALV
jgi:preprotein translocase subunit SecA